MRGKRVSRLLAISVLIVFMLGTVAAAAGVPNETIFVGDKAYDKSLMNDLSLKDEILVAFIANGNTFIYKDVSGNYYDPGKNVVDPAAIPAGTYKDANKAEKGYGAGDTEAVVGDFAKITPADVATKDGITGISFGVKVDFPAGVTNVKVTKAGDIDISPAKVLTSGVWANLPGTYSEGNNVIVFAYDVDGVTKTVTIAK